MRASNAARLFRTVRHLRASQLLWQLRYRLLPRAGAPAAPRNLECRELGWIPGAPPRASGSGSEFRFLNVARRLEGTVDWHAAEMARLWRYNLHYFDYALDPHRSREHVAALIDGWIRANPPGTADAWEPYTASLRIVNWIKYFVLRHRTAHVPERWLESLWQQAAWLARNLERHILANHYLKNAKALVFAGAFFDDIAARRWLADGTQLFAEQIAEQFLADGGHYERSPMYHALGTEDLLDVLNLAQQTPALFSDGFRETVAASAVRALRWLDAMCLPDGEISLFNDSALGIAPAPRALHEYASTLGIEWPGIGASGRHAGLRGITLEASGYFVVADGQDKIVIDCGAIGPDHQPGHAHCDTLSYELALAGRRIVVDAGVHDYEPSEHRRYARSTAAHNTVVVDGAEQSELWGTFRVARRARPRAARLAPRGDGGFRFEGAHDGYGRLPGNVLHTRAIEIAADFSCRVQDVLEGRGRHRAESFVHIHPDCRAQIERGAVAVTGGDGTRIATIEPDDGADLRIEPGRHFPAFGCALRNDVVVISANGALPLRFGYRIAKPAQ